MSAATARRRSICSGVSSSAAGPSQAIRSSLRCIGLLLVAEIRVVAAAVQAGQGLAADAACETVTLGGAVRLVGEVDDHLARGMTVQRCGVSSSFGLQIGLDLSDLA